MGFGVHEGFRLDGQSSLAEVDGGSCSRVCGEQVSDESSAPSDRLESVLFTLCGQTCSLRSACHSRASHPQTRLRPCVLAVLRDSMAFELAIVLLSQSAGIVS